jgi:adenylosuccinate lyase
MQSPPIGELSEPFGRDQVGSSAMPFKRNPIQSEKIDSLSRELAQMPRTAWDNAAHSMLERTLDDSANRRTILPESFLMADELIHITRRVIEGLQVNEGQLVQNLARYGPFAASERVLMALGKAGADRQAMHERLRQHAMKAWESVKAGESNPLVEAILGDPEINEYVPEEELRSLMEVEGYIGLAPQRARALADMILQAIQ